MSAPKIVELAEVQNFLQDNPHGVLLDSLPPEHYARRHLPGAKQACVYEVVFPDCVKDLAPDPNTPILTYGAGHSLDAGVAAAKLLGLGYSDVRMFSGGIEAWQKAGLPLEGTDPYADESPYPSQVPAHHSYRLLPEESGLQWIGRTDSHGHHGDLKLKGGWLGYVDGKFSGQVVADMTSINAKDLLGLPELPVLLEHLTSPDFFDTAKYPEASLEILDLTLIEGSTGALPNYRAKVKITIRGHEQILEGLAQLANLPHNKLVLYAQGDLDRTKFGVLYGSARFFRFLGGHKVNDLINLNANLIFQA